MCHEDMEVQSCMSDVDAVSSPNHPNGVCLHSSSNCSHLGLVETEGGLTRLCCVLIYSRLRSVSHRQTVFCSAAPAPSCGPSCSRAAPREGFQGGRWVISSGTGTHLLCYCPPHLPSVPLMGVVHEVCKCVLPLWKRKMHLW